MSKSNKWTYAGILTHQYLKSGSKKNGSESEGLDTVLRTVNVSDHIIVQCEGEIQQYNKKDGENVTYIPRKYGCEDKAKFITEHCKHHVMNMHIPSLYEVIFDGPQKFKLDIDLSRKDHPILIDDKETIESLIPDLVSCIPMDYTKCMIFTSHCPIGSKLSWHIVPIGVYVSNNKQAQMVYKQTIEKFRSEFPHHVEELESAGTKLETTIDEVVYKSTQNFRLLWSSKAGKNRPKIFEGFYEKNDFAVHYRPADQFNERYIDSAETKTQRIQREVDTARDIFMGSLISHVEGYCHSVEIPRAVREVNYETFDLCNVEIDTMMKLLNESPKYPSNYFKIREVSNNSINLTNPQGYHCPSCLRRHDNENPHIFAIPDGKYPVLFNCRRGGKSVHLGYLDPDRIEEDNDDNSKSPPVTPPVVCQSPMPVMLSPQPVQLTISEPASPTNNSRDVDYLRKMKVRRYLASIEILEYEQCENRYVEAHDFDQNPVIGVKAPMGKGKTHAMMEYNKRHIDSKVLDITPRRSLANSVEGEFRKRGIPVSNYLKEKPGFISGENTVIISPESIYRYNDMPDTLFIDEIETVMASFCGRYHRDKLNVNRETFTALLKHSKNVCVMDAEMTERSVRFLKNFRPELKIHRYTSLLDRIFVRCAEGALYTHIRRCLLKGEKLVFACSTKTQTDEVIDVINHIAGVDNLPHIRGKLVNSEQDDDPDFFTNINEEILKYDVLVHTNSLGVGVSIDVVHFDRLFVLTSNMKGTPPVSDVYQMTGRVRTYKKKKFYLVEDLRKNFDKLPSNMTALINEDVCNRKFTNSLGSKIVKRDYDTVKCKWVNKRVLDPWTQLEAEFQLDNNMSYMYFKEYFEIFGERKGYKFVDDNIPEGDIVHQPEGAGINVFVNTTRFTMDIHELINVSLHDAHVASNRNNAKSEQKQALQVDSFEKHFESNPNLYIEKPGLKGICEIEDPNDHVTCEFGPIVTYQNTMSERHIFRNIKRLKEPLDKVISHEMWLRKRSKTLNKYAEVGRFLFLHLVLKCLGIEGQYYDFTIEKEKWDACIGFIRQHHSEINSLIGGSVRKVKIEDDGRIGDIAAIGILKRFLKTQMGIDFTHKRVDKKINGTRTTYHSYTTKNDDNIGNYVEILDRLVPYKYHHAFEYRGDQNNDGNIYNGIEGISMIQQLEMLT